MSAKKPSLLCGRMCDVESMESWVRVRGWEREGRGVASLEKDLSTSVSSGLSLGGTAGPEDCACRIAACDGASLLSTGVFDVKVGIE